VSDEAVELLEIQAVLRNDADGTAGREMEAQLAQLHQELKRRLDAGAPPDEYNRLAALNEAVVAASQVLAGAWRSYHKA
jgi:uncharacterized membrane-anchored protein